MLWPAVCQMSNGRERSTAALAGAVSRLRTVCELGRGSAAPWKNSQDLHSAILSGKTRPPSELRRVRPAADMTRRKELHRWVRESSLHSTFPRVLLTELGCLRWQQIRRKLFVLFVWSLGAQTDSRGAAVGEVTTWVWAVRRVGPRTGTWASVVDDSVQVLFVFPPLRVLLVDESGGTDRGAYRLLWLVQSETIIRTFFNKLQKNSIFFLLSFPPKISKSAKSCFC